MIPKPPTEEALGYFIPGDHCMLMGQVKAALPDAIRVLRATGEAGNNLDASILEDFAKVLECSFNEWVLRSLDAIRREHAKRELINVAEAEQLAEVVRNNGIQLVADFADRREIPRVTCTHTTPDALCDVCRSKQTGEPLKKGPICLGMSSIPGPGRMSYRESMVDAGRGHLLRGDE